MAKGKKRATPKKTSKKAVKKVEKKVKCAAKTKAGKACTRYAVGKSKFCDLHKRKKK